MTIVETGIRTASKGEEKHLPELTELGLVLLRNTRSGQLISVEERNRDAASLQRVSSESTGSIRTDKDVSPQYPRLFTANGAESANSSSQRHAAAGLRDNLPHRIFIAASVSGKRLFHVSLLFAQVRICVRNVVDR